MFFDKLGNGSPSYNSEASSHEFGHNLGLSHDGTSSVGYYQGQGSGLVSWAPIMGNSYYNNITQWSKGEYADANQSQDDLAIIDGHLGYVSDDHGNNTGSASTLVINGSGQVVSSNPELDPHNYITDNKGVINSATDVDVFTFVSGAGALSLTVNPSWDAFYNGSSRRGSNLDVEAQLQDLNGTPIQTANPTNDTTATISTTVAAGTYHLRVRGVGNGDPAVTGYSAYNSMGQYFINGSVSVADPDVTAPTPDPMTWASKPTATGQNSIAMMASTATDETSSSVEYRFNCTTTNGSSAPCVAADSNWQSSSSYTANGLEASISYTFLARARDQSGNETAAANPESATTDTPPPPPPPPATPGNFVAIGVSETAINLTWTDVATETGYRVERSVGGDNSFSPIATLAANASSYPDSGLSAGTYDYLVYAVNGTVDSAPASASGTTDTPPPPPPPPPFVDVTASSENLIAGAITSGNLSSTYTENGSVESIRERESGGKKNSRHSFVEHRWNFTLGEGDSVTVYAVARSGGSSDGDTFDFEYSLDGGTTFESQVLFNVSSPTYALYSGVIPGAPSGSVIIRVVDTDQGTGNRGLDTVDVDHLFIQVGSPSIDPPIGDPSGLNATVASSSSIDLSWVDGTENESGFTVEHSLTGTGGWILRDTIAAGSNSYTDTGLDPETTYYYQVQAFYGNGFSAYTTDNATTDTDVGTALGLEASGYKSKGVKIIDLTWTDSTLVDVYRNGGSTPIATNVSGSTYIDNTGSKGSGTYTHKVCVATTNTCSNTTTTVF